MQLIIDTHTFLWFTSANPQLSTKALSLIEDPTNEVFLSLASPWEVGIKVSVGKLKIGRSLSSFFELRMQKWANSAPVHVFPSGTQMLLLAGGSALVIAVNLLPDSGLLFSESFSFDIGESTFSANGRFVTGLDKITVHLQDGFGPSRRALRIIVTAWGRNYVVAQTPRFTTATLMGKEYSSTVTNEGMQKKHWFNQWADYAGAKTGFSSKWPEYQEIFALHTELTQIIESAKSEMQTERER